MLSAHKLYPHDKPLGIDHLGPVDYDRMFLYIFEETTYPNKCKMGERFVKAGLDPWEDCCERIRDQLNTAKSKFKNGYIKIVAIIDASEAAEKVDRNRAHGKFDDYIREGMTDVLDGSSEEHNCTGDEMVRRINAKLLGSDRPNSFPPSQEQQECIDKAVAWYKDPNTDNRFLMNAIMRFGKTFDSYKIAQACDFNRVLVLSYKPSIRSGWKEDLETHTDFEGSVFVDAKDFDRDNPVVLDNSGDFMEVLFASFQDLNDWDKPKWQNIFKYDFDLLIIDEQHYGSLTARAQDTLRQLKFYNTLDVSGTPLKTLMRGDYHDDQIFSWTYQDEQRRKREKLEAGSTDNRYRWLPSLKLATFEVNEQAKAMCSHYDPEEGFSMMKFLASDDGIEFNDRPAVEYFLDNHFGLNCKKSQSPYRSYSADHQLWIVPGVNHGKALINLLESKYGDQIGQVLDATGSDGIKEINKIKQLITHFDKSVTISCGRFNTGVTVKPWDLVVMLDDGTSAQEYFQTIFRVKSQDAARKKEYGVVIDYNVERCIKAVYTYSEVTAKAGQSPQDNLKEFLDFTPIMDHGGNRVREIDVDRILNMVANEGNYVEKFGQSYLYNFADLDDIRDLYSHIDPETGKKVVDMTIADNGLDKGKNFEITRPNSPPKQTDEEAKRDREDKQRILTVMKRIPTYIYLENDLDLHTAEDIIKANNNDLFEEVTGISLAVFGLTMQKIAQNDRWNRAVMSFNLLKNT